MGFSERRTVDHLEACLERSRQHQRERRRLFADLRAKFPNESPQSVHDFFRYLLATVEGGVEGSLLLDPSTRSQITHRNIREILHEAPQAECERCFAYVQQKIEQLGLEKVLEEAREQEG